jgi:hypothetical protein
MAAVEGTGLARALRDSVWVYPFVNAGHILGIALLVGSIVPLDLRLLGAWRSIPLASLWHVLTRTAAAGLLLAATFGLLLFATRATEYIASGFFIAKMAVVALATANAVSLRLFRPATFSAEAFRTGAPPRRLRIAAGMSLLGWLTALTLGRLVGYFQP